MLHYVTLFVMRNEIITLKKTEVFILYCSDIIRPRDNL